MDDSGTLSHSNDETMFMEKQINDEIQQISALKSQAANQEENIAAIINHLSIVQEQITEKKNLCEAKKREIESEKRLQSLAVSEESRISQCINNIQKQMEDIDGKIKGHKNNISMLKNKVQTTSDSIQWDGQAASSWLEEAMFIDDDRVILKDNLHNDELKLNVLELQLQKLSRNELDKERLLNRSSIDLKHAQIELEKSGIEFKMAHNGRQDIIYQWESTLKQMQKRDAEVELYITENVNLKNQLLEIEKMAATHQHSLQRLSKNRQRIDESITKANGCILKLKEKLLKDEQKLAKTKVEVSAMSSINKKDAILHKMQLHIENLDKEISTKLGSYQKQKQSLDKLSGDFQVRINIIESSKDNRFELENFLWFERNELEIIRKEVQKATEQQSQEVTLLQALNDKEKKIILEIKKWKSVIHNCVMSLLQLDNKYMKQEKILSDLEEEFHFVWECNRTMQNAIQNDSSTKSKLQLLLVILNGKINACKTLNVDIKQQENDIKLAKERHLKNTTEFSDINSKLIEVNLKIENAEKNLEMSISMKQKVLVDENIIKLEIRRLQEVILDKSNSTISLEKQKLNIENKIQKRQQDIEVIQELLKVEIQLVKELKQNIIKEINECQMQIKKFQKRCEIILMPLKSWNTSTEITTVHFLIKAAEDKNNLHKETSEMKEKLQKAKKELKAFESTASFLKTKTENLHSSLEMSSCNSELMEEKNKLSVKIQIDYQDLKIKREDTLQIKRYLLLNEDTFKKMEKDEEEFDEMIIRMQSELHHLENIMHDYKEKLQRASQQISTLNQFLELNSTSSIAKADVLLRIIIDKNKSITMAIEEFIGKYPHFEGSASISFSKANLPQLSTAEKFRRKSSCSSLCSLKNAALKPIPKAMDSIINLQGSTKELRSKNNITFPSVTNLDFHKV